MWSEYCHLFLSPDSTFSSFLELIYGYELNFPPHPITWFHHLIRYDLIHKFHHLIRNFITWFQNNHQKRRRAKRSGYAFFGLPESMKISVSPDFRRFYVWLVNPTKFFDENYGTTCIRQTYVQDTLKPNFRIYLIPEVGQKWTGRDHLFEVKSEFSRVYVFPQHIEVGMGNITGSLVFNWYMSRVPWYQISELALNRKWVKSEQQMVQKTCVSMFYASVNIFEGFTFGLGTKKV